MELIAQNLDVVGMVLAVLALMSGLSKFLEFIKDKTSTQADNKLYEYLNKGIAIVQKLLDLFMGNPKHK